MRLSWGNITVKQFQNFIEAGNNVDPVERSLNMASALTDLPISAVEDLSPEGFNNLCKECNRFLGTYILEKPVRFIKIRGRKYKIIYDLTNITIGQKRKLQCLGEGIFDYKNIHVVTACLVHRVNWLGKRIEADLSEVASDILDCSIVPVVTACRFYSELFIKMKAVKQ